MKTKPAKPTSGKGATPMNPNKLLRKRFVCNINRKINQLRKDGKL